MDLKVTNAFISVLDSFRLGFWFQKSFKDTLEAREWLRFRPDYQTGGQMWHFQPIHFEESRRKREAASSSTKEKKRQM